MTTVTDVTDATREALVPSPRPAPEASATVPARRVGTPWRARCLSPGVGILVAATLTVLGARGMGDDSYISLDYARTLLEHGQWGLVPGRTANTATSPLNVWLLAAGLALTGTVTGAVGLVLASALAAVGLGADRIARLVGAGPLLPLSAMALLATSPLLVSTIGLETYLGVAVVVAAATATMTRRPGVAGALCGLAVLVRPDCAIPAAVVVLALWRPPGLRVRVRGLVRAGLAAVVVFLPWHVWAWYELGGFVPDTFSFKTNPAAGRVPAMIADFAAATTVAGSSAGRRWR